MTCKFKILSRNSNLCLCITRHDHDTMNLGVMAVEVFTALVANLIFETRRPYLLGVVRLTVNIMYHLEADCVFPWIMNDGVIYSCNREYCCQGLFGNV